MVYPQKGGKRTALEEKGRKGRGSGEIISTGQRAQSPCGCPEEGRKERRKCVRDIVEEMYGGLRARYGTFRRVGRADCQRRGHGAFTASTVLFIFVFLSDFHRG